MVMNMAQDIIRAIEQDLREVVEAEIARFRDRYSDCQVVNSIYLNEHISLGIHDIQLHGLVCDHYLNLYVAGNTIYEFPEFRCWVTYEDVDTDFKRHMAHIVLLYTVNNRCYIKSEFHVYELREVAEHIYKSALEIAREEEGINEG